ncbi:MAG: tRNA pseudouridine(38-40) synthase TruA [Bacteroidota bacterium]
MAKLIGDLRYFLDIAYKGTNFHGWQIQANASSVQAEIEAKLALIFQKKTPIVGSGRTDTGVHAQQQMAHLDVTAPLTYFQHIYKLNSLLPPDIAIRDAYPVNDEAHARFDAVARTYEYHIRSLKDPFSKELAYFNHQKLDLDLMNEAAHSLLKYEDFQAFSKVKTEVNHFLCDIKKAYWEYRQEHHLVFTIVANRFLRGMVRAIVGTMLNIGTKKLNLSGFDEVIQSRDRSRAGFAVPPQGLFLMKVAYPYPLNSIIHPSEPPL